MPLRLLFQNRISHISTAAFSGIGGTLTALDLSHNRLTTLASGIFDGLVFLQRLSVCQIFHGHTDFDRQLFGNQIAVIPGFAFHKQAQLDLLFVSIVLAQVSRSTGALTICRHSRTSQRMHYKASVGSQRCNRADCTGRALIPRSYLYNTSITSLDTFQFTLTPKLLLLFASVPGGSVSAVHRGLRNTRIAEIPPALFAPLQSMQVLVFENMPLRQLAPDLLANLVSLAAL
jgi:hypothetical protein